MIRWASCGLVMLLCAAVGSGQTADALREISGIAGILEQVRPNPFGGAPVPLPAGVIRQQLLVLLEDEVRPSRPAPPPRQLRPVYSVPGPPKLDRHGDPLPAGAIARFGTVRLRHGEVQAAAFSPDGKQLFTTSNTEDSVRVWDAVSGKEVTRLNTAADLIGMANDGSAVVADDARVRHWLPATNTLRELPEKTVPEGTSATALAVNPDGRSFALATEKKVLVIDVQTGKTLRELALPLPPQQNNNNGRGGLAINGPDGNPPQPGPPPTRLVYSPDGRWLAGNGQKTGVWLWELRTGKRVRTYRSEDDFPEYAFSPDVTKLAVTGQQVRLFPLDAEEPVEGFKPLDVVAFAPRFSADGKTLYVVQQDAAVLPIDTTTGAAKDELAAPEPGLRPPFALAPGGAHVMAIDSSGGIRIWDPKTGKGPEVDRLTELSDPGFSSDGKTVTVIDVENTVRAFDAATGAAGKVIELPGPADGFPATWDAGSRRAATILAGGDDLEVHFTDADTGKVLCKHSVPNDSGLPVVAFAAANRDRAALFTQRGVTVINPTTGKTVRTFNTGARDNGFQGVLSPDGRLVAVRTDPVSVWEVATGKKRLAIDGLMNAGELAFSPDSRLLVASDRDGKLVVADVRTGAVVRRFELPDGPERGVTALAVSPDGKRLAAGTIDGRVTLWDVPAGEVLAPFGGHDRVVTGLCFSADGARLASAAADGTVLVWEVPVKAVAAAPAGDAAVGGWDEAFRLLGSADAGHAQRGLDYLYRHPADAAKQAGERLPVPTATPAAKIARYVEELGSEEFPTREAARAALEALAGEAGAALKLATEKSPSAEVRKVASTLMGRIDAPATRADDLRIVRAVEAMENLRTADGRGQLEKWAGGPPGHRLTVEAAAALARLKPAGK